MQDGLGDIGHDFPEMKAGRVGGEKLIYHIAGEGEGNEIL
jgi:hypothetical protein